MMDASVLLPPTGTPLTGIDFVKRLPCGDVEKTRRVGSCKHKDNQECCEFTTSGVIRAGAGRWAWGNFTLTAADGPLFVDT